ncbi:MAG: single-stranded-DNA-specific exonuclease RecJ [Microcoleaceae cyanobacterium]
MWQIQPSIQLPSWMLPTLHQHAPHLSGKYAAQLLLARGIQTPEQVTAFLDPDAYQPGSPQEFGLEMTWAVERLQQARDRQETVTIWGDFDADGVTSTSVLWEGLSQFFQPNLQLNPQLNFQPNLQQNLTPESTQLSYYIPNRLTESHGLNLAGIQTLAAQGCTLIVTCDTGSTNLEEIKAANHLGIDVIVTDHHTLPQERPPVVAMINPRTFPLEHPLRHLSGVAVAYKLVEALYQATPELPQHTLENLLDLVAIGLIADLVQLTGDCRYLAQRGLQRLQAQLNTPTRPGVAKLLELCKRSGDRPTDISFGIGPRINAVSRIYGDAKFCVELLTSRDRTRCMKLALDTEIANSRRKALQKEVVRDVERKLEQLDLSTTGVIILTDSQWPTGILGLVASQVAQQYGRPTILLSIEEGTQAVKLARGSARSVGGIDLYELVSSQAHLLHRFGGHPFAAGLSLNVENLPLFTDGINRQLRATFNHSGALIEPHITVDLVCTVAELSKELFQELKLLEPCGMGNPAPKILINNCWFTDLHNANQQDIRGAKVSYIKTTFNLWDDSTAMGFPGVWWGHYTDEIPAERCDILVELDFNSLKKRYEVRLLEIRSTVSAPPVQLPQRSIDQILDWRHLTSTLPTAASEFQQSQPLSPPLISPLVLKDCPNSWSVLQAWFYNALTQQRPLAIAYTLPLDFSAVEVLENLVGIAKYLSRTQQLVTRQQLLEKLTIGESSLQLGFDCLKTWGFKIEPMDRAFQITQTPLEETKDRQSQLMQKFLSAVQEEHFRRRYFCEVPIETIQAIADQTSVSPLVSPVESE